MPERKIRKVTDEELQAALNRGECSLYRPFWVGMVLTDWLAVLRRRGLVSFERPNFENRGNRYRMINSGEGFVN